MRRPRPEPAEGPDTESVWDYPRPPAVDPSDRQVEIDFGGRTIATSRDALRVLETSHPPTWYLPRSAFDADVLRPVASGRTTVCEFKGRASYFDVVVGDRIARAAAWTYANPAPGFEQLRDHVAVMPGAMDECRVDGEVVQAQEGDFYGGWITSDVRGPFKGGAGTLGW